MPEVHGHTSIAIMPSRDSDPFRVVEAQLAATRDEATEGPHSPMGQGGGTSWRGGVIGAAVGVFSAAPPIARQFDIGGTFDGCRMVAGDTLRCGGERIRLLAIDAPEPPGHCRPGRAGAPGDPVAPSENLGAGLVGRKAAGQQSAHKLRTGFEISRQSAMRPNFGHSEPARPNLKAAIRSCGR
ncbi:hypothetical protein [Sphingomonas sp. JC676]|uniref:hypothetical protein n=1 Tax=Sphingomonas sp. JC676 TaxID=2768065 RepID=UPI00223AB6E1|nr:hypothetical protein [Sphingomonas sp. JC676]